MVAKVGLLHCVTALLFLFVAGVSSSAEDTESTTPTGSNVHELQTLQDFYAHVNNNEHKYTFIKYYTTWCSHCKMLKPIFEKVAKAYVPFLPRQTGENSVDNTTAITLFGKPLLPTNSSTPQVSYMEVECDLWGPYHICSRLPGYPVLELITPVDDVSQKFIMQDKELRKTLEEEHYNSLGLWAQAWYNVKNFFTSLGGAAGQDLEDMQYVMRKVEYQGKRRADKICDWLDMAILHDLERNVQSKILAGDCMGDEVCAAGLQWFEGIKNNLHLEKKKLENILNNEENNTKEVANDDDALRTLKFKLHLVEKSLELSQSDPIIDEL